VGLSLPPSKQVVHSVGRDTFLEEPVGAAPLTLGTRPYETATLKNGPCWSLVVLHASIHMVSATQGITGQARGFTVVAFDWPLVTSGANALYAFLDQGARNLAAKEASDAKKRGGDIKY
jgi:hypothetical protein